MNGLELVPMRGGTGSVPAREASVDVGEGLALGSREAAIDVPYDFVSVKKEPLRPPGGFNSGSRAGSGSSAHNELLLKNNTSNTNGRVPSAQRAAPSSLQQNTPLKAQAVPQPQLSYSNPAYSNHSRQPSAGSQQMLSNPATSVYAKTQPAPAAPSTPSAVVNGVGIKSDARDRPNQQSTRQPKNTDDLQERARHHQEELKRRAEEHERAERESEWLRASLRESKKLQRLEHRPAPSMQPEFVE